jgi:hypothetical protein
MQRTGTERSRKQKLINDISIHTQTYIEFHRQPGLGQGSDGKAFVTDLTQSPNIFGVELSARPTAA